MANLDLEEQEQLDQLKHFWRQYGNAITWVLIAALTAYAGWNGWQWYQRNQALKAGGMFAELDKAAQAGDAERAGKVFADLKGSYGGTAFAEQGGLVAARVQLEKGQADAARGSLEWVAEHATETEFRAVARLRLAALLLDQGKADEALKQVSGDFPSSFQALAADRKGDILMAQDKKAEAVAAYKAAYEQLDAAGDYRRIVDAKLTALGAAPVPAVAASAATGASQ